MPVPARGWTYPVRVCNSCKEILSKKRDACPGMFCFAYFNSILFIEKSKTVQFYIAVMFNCKISIRNFYDTKNLNQF